MKNALSKLPKNHFASPTKTIWILVDVSNSNQRSKNYLWWFETRALARSHLEHQRTVYPDKATLIGPYKYITADRKRTWPASMPHPRGATNTSKKSSKPSAKKVTRSMTSRTQLQERKGSLGPKSTQNGKAGRRRNSAKD